MSCMIFFFFFQAEDGIRDRNVTGVQTCALPIYHQGSAILATSSIGVEAAVDNTIGTPTEVAPRATAVSASWWTCSNTPIGAVNRGVGYCSPKRVMPRSPALSDPGRRLRGRSA